MGAAIFSQFFLLNLYTQQLLHLLRAEDRFVLARSWSSRERRDHVQRGASGNLAPALQEAA